MGEFAALALQGFILALAQEGITAGESYPSLNCRAASRVWLDHRMLLAEPDDILDNVRAVPRYGHTPERSRPLLNVV
jgi:hypothetical protein